MANDTYDFPLDGGWLPAGVWTEVKVGPVEICVTATDNVLFRFSATQPTSDRGHFRRANEDLVGVVLDGQSLWVFAERKFRLAVTEAAIS